LLGGAADEKELSEDARIAPPGVISLFGGGYISFLISPENR
jgi:hypothetical protein